MDISKIGLGGGCHWCTEGVFSVIKGVEQIDQGWIASTPPNDEFSEAIVVYYDSSIIELKGLITIHLHTHACTSNHSMRGKYRSAIYFFDEIDVPQTKEFINDCQQDFEKPIITSILPLVTFKSSPEIYQDYYQKNPEKPFCKTYITPKIQLLMKEFGKKWMIDR